MNKREAILLLEKKRDKAIGDMSFFGEGSRKGLMNEIRVNTYDIAINTLEQIDEPQADKVEVPEFVAEWYESNKHKLERAIIDVACSMEKGEFPYNLPFEDWFIDPENHPIETLIRMMKDGYTVKPKRWVVKFNDDDDNYQNYYFNGWMPDDPLDPNGDHCKTDKSVIKFTDKEQAEALATLIDGEAEEVAE